MKKNSVIIFLLILFLLGITYFLVLQINKSKVIPDTTKQEDTQKEDQTNKKNETDSWNIYNDYDAVFSVKYPSEVNFEGTESNKINLSIKTSEIDSLDGAMGFNKETAEKNVKPLKNGKYGELVDWPLEISKKVRDIKGVNAQEFVVLSRFDVCDVTFERKLYFLNNNHQTVITLSGAKEDIIKSSKDYFKIDKENCGEAQVWNFEKRDEFYKNLVNNQGSDIAMKWFNLFDEIVNTIDFDSVAVLSAGLEGRWVSLDDEKSEIEFLNSKKIDYYQNEKISEEDFKIENHTLTVMFDSDELKYSIDKISSEELVLTYLSRGNILKYKKYSEVDSVK